VEEIDLRCAGALDVELLSALHGECLTAAWDRPWLAKSFAEILALPGATAWLASKNGEPLGFALGSCAADEIDILLIAILPAWRRHGFARLLLQRLLEAAAKAGIKRAVLEVASGNAPALAFYARLGFSKCGLRKNYYGDGVDALLLEKQLVAS